MEGNWIHPDDRSKEFGALVAKGKGKTVKYLLSLALHRIGFGALRWVFDIYFFVAGVCHTLQILGLVSISGCGGHYYFWLSAFGHILTLVDELWAFGLKHCVVDARPFRAFSFFGAATRSIQLCWLVGPLWETEQWWAVSCWLMLDKVALARNKLLLCYGTNILELFVTVAYPAYPALVH